MEQKTQTHTYGLTSTTFKARLGVHKNAFKDPEANQTALSSQIWDFKKRKIGHTIKWKLVDCAKRYSPLSRKCQLCVKEILYILFHPNMANLNSRSDIYANCRHKKCKVLIKPNRKKKPGSGPD